jgi:hypothetical protein
VAARTQRVDQPFGREGGVAPDRETLNIGGSFDGTARIADALKRDCALNAGGRDGVDIFTLFDFDKCETALNAWLPEGIEG